MTTAVATNKLSGKWIGWLTSLLGGLFVAWCFYDPSTPKVNLYWFGTIMAIGMFAFDLLPNFVTAVLLLMYYILTGIAAPDVAFIGAGVVVIFQHEGQILHGQRTQRHAGPESHRRRIFL